MKNVITANVRTGTREPRVSTARVHWLQRELPDPEDQRKYARERCVVAVTEAIGEAMEHAGRSRAQVAAKLGTTRGHITKLLGGAHNMTLHSLSDLLWACDAEVQDLDLVDLGVVEVPIDVTKEWVTGSASNVASRSAS